MFAKHYKDVKNIRRCVNFIADCKNVGRALMMVNKTGQLCTCGIYLREFPQDNNVRVRKCAMNSIKKQVHLNLEFDKTKGYKRIVVIAGLRYNVNKILHRRVISTSGNRSP